MVDALDGMARVIDQTKNLDSGELSVGAGSYVADVWLGQVAGRVLRQYPRLHLSLHVEPWEILPDLLRQGRIDLFIATIEHVRGRKEFQIVEFPHQRGIWVCRAGHALAGQRAPSRLALEEFTIIGPQIPDSIRRWMKTNLSHYKGLDRKIDTTSVNMIKAMIRAGDAVSLVHPDMVRAEIASGEFVTLAFDAPPVVFQAGLVWLADRSLSPAAMALVRELLSEVGLAPDCLAR